jgi:ferredoxin
VCKIDIEPYKTPNSVECIRCGKCKKKCPTSAIS